MKSSHYCFLQIPTRKSEKKKFGQIFCRLYFPVVFGWYYTRVGLTLLPCFKNVNLWCLRPDRGKKVFCSRYLLNDIFAVNNPLSVSGLEGNPILQSIFLSRNLKFTFHFHFGVAPFLSRQTLSNTVKGPYTLIPHRL